MTAFQPEAIRELFRHMEWADAAVWHAVVAHEPARRDDLLRGYLVHLHNVQRAFLDIWTGRAVSFLHPAAFPDVASLRPLVVEYYPRAHAFAATVEPAALDRPLVLPWAGELAAELGRAPGATTVGETMFQVTSHSTYHRGQINARLRAVGGTPPLVDYIAWLWFGRPSADWQFAEA